MKNSEKYKTKKERNRAFSSFCNTKGKCQECVLNSPEISVPVCAFAWLELEAAKEEEPMPCPFCGSEVRFLEKCGNQGRGWFECTKNDCGYTSGEYDSKDRAVANHNRICRAVSAAKKGEVK